MCRINTEPESSGEGLKGHVQTIASAGVGSAGVLNKRRLLLLLVLYYIHLCTSYLNFERHSKVYLVACNREQNG